MKLDGIDIESKFITTIYKIPYSIIKAIYTMCFLELWQHFCYKDKMFMMYIAFLLGSVIISILFYICSKNIKYRKGKLVQKQLKVSIKILYSLLYILIIVVTMIVWQILNTCFNSIIGGH